MTQYRRPDQVYYDNYDRHTIAALKEIEILETQRLDAIPDAGKRHAQVVADILTGQTFHDACVLACRTRTQTVEALIKNDEQRDRLVDAAPRPAPPRCETCLQTMVEAGSMVKEASQKVIFLFDCPDGHKKRRAFYSDGTEHLSKKSCLQCGSARLTTRKKETKKKLTFTDTCKDCGHVEVLELDQTPDPPVDETERSKYLFAYAGKRTQQEELGEFLQLLHDIKKSTDEKEAKEMLELDKIEKPTIQQLQQKITPVLAEKGFMNLQLDKPVLIKDVITVGFAIQDTLERPEKKSEKDFTKLLSELLMPTNWRMFPKSAEYRLGYLIGNIKGYERQADLEKLAREIIAQNTK